MSAIVDWHLGHVVRLMGGRGSGSIEARINRHPKRRLFKTAHRMDRLTCMDSRDPWTGHLTKPAQVHVCEVDIDVLTLAHLRSTHLSLAA